MNPPSELVFSTAAVPERERLAWFREEICEQLGVAFDAPDPSSLDAGFSVRQVLGQPMILAWSRGAAHYERTRRLIAAGGDEGYSLGIELAGRLEGRIGRRRTEYAIGGGDCFIVDRSRPAESDLPHGARQVFITLPRANLESLLPDPSVAGYGFFRASTPMATLLTAHLHALWEIAGRIDGASTPAVLDVTCRLIALALGTSPQRVDGARASVNHARREAALALIQRSFTDPEFNAERAAAQLGISRRTLHRLFEDGELSFTECVRRRRLAYACRLLARGEMTVAQVAFAAGFNEISTFNRAFRAWYGMTPSEARHFGFVPATGPDSTRSRPESPR